MLNKFEIELKSAIMYQRIKKEDFFDSPVRHGYIVVSAGGNTLYLVDLINYMYSSEKHIIVATSITSLKEYALDPKKVSIRKSSDLDKKLIPHLYELIDTGRLLHIDQITLYLGHKEYDDMPKVVKKKV